MKKNYLITLYSSKAKISYAEAERRINDILETLVEIFKKEERLMIRNFGVFMVKEVKRQETTHPKTGEKIKIEPRKYVQFKMAKKLLYF